MYTEENEYNNEYEDNYSNEYEENNDNSYPYKKLVIKIIVLFLCLLLAIWLISKLVNSGKRMKQNDGMVFNNNVQSLKEGAEQYFFKDNNLPASVNDSITISLSELNEKGKVVPLYDYANKACSTNINDSYATITKNTSYYELVIKLTCASEQKEYSYFYEIENSTDTKENNNNQDNNSNNNQESNNLNINCSTWSEWTTTKLNSDDLLIRTRTLIKGYKVMGSTITYGPWSDWTQNEIVKTDTLDVETRVSTVTTWSSNKTTTNKISNSNNIRVVDVQTVYNAGTCTNQKNKEKVSGELTPREYAELEKQGLIISLLDSYWTKVNNNYVKVYKAVYYKETVKTQCTSGKNVMVYTYQELITKNITEYRSREIIKTINDKDIVYTDYVLELEDGYTKVSGSEKIEYSYKDASCK